MAALSPRRDTTACASVSMLPYRSEIRRSSSFAILAAARVRLSPALAISLVSPEQT